VQNADSLSLFDDPDAVLQSGSSVKRVAMLRQVTALFLTDLFLSDEDRLPDCSNQAVSMALPSIAGRNSRKKMALRRYFGGSAR
jgi:hypothetical protein